MAVGITARTKAIDLTDATSWSTAAFTPAASELLVACYESQRASSTNPNTPTVTGHDGGEAWALIADHLYETDATVRRHLFIFACVTGASPTSGSITFDHGAVTTSAAGWSVFEITGADEANGLAQTFVQAVDGPTDPLTNTSVSITLAGAGNSANRPFGFFARNGTQVIAPRASWTEIHEHTNGYTIETQWRSDAFETTASASWVTTVTQFSGIAWEIKNLVAGGGGGRPTMLLRGAG